MIEGLKQIFSVDIKDIILFFVAAILFIEGAIKSLSFLTNFFGITTKKSQEVQTYKDRLEKLEKHDNWQYNSIVRLQSEVSTGFSEIKNIISNNEEKHDQELIATSRSTLYRMYREGMERGYITQIELETFEDIASVYLTAGGNHTMKSKIIPEYEKLPIREG